MLAPDRLVVMQAVLATPITLEDAAFGWRSQYNSHLQRPDLKVTFHAIADGPTIHRELCDCSC